MRERLSLCVDCVLLLRTAGFNYCKSKQSYNFQLLCAEIIRGLRKKRPRMKLSGSGGAEKRKKEKKKKKKKRAKGKKRRKKRRRPKRKLKSVRHFVYRLIFSCHFQSKLFIDFVNFGCIQKESKSTFWKGLAVGEEGGGWGEGRIQ